MKTVDYCPQVRVWKELTQKGDLPRVVQKEHLAATLNVTTMSPSFSLLATSVVLWVGVSLPVHDVFSVLGTLSNLLVFGKPEVIGLTPCRTGDGSIGLGH